MTLVTCTDVQRWEGLPLYTVKINDVDNPVNFHSYDCVFFKQGNELKPLLEEAERTVKRLKRREQTKLNQKKESLHNCLKNLVLTEEEIKSYQNAIKEIDKQINILQK